MSSAAAGGAKKTTRQGNEAKIDAGMLGGEGPGEFAATSAVSAEAQQGDGPAAASAGASGSTADTVDTVAVAVSCGKDYAVAACPVAVAAVGVNSASAGSENGVVAVGGDGAAASSNAANASETAVRDQQGAGLEDDPEVLRLLGAIRAELTRLAAESAEIKAELGWSAHPDDPPANARAVGATREKRARADNGGRRQTAQRSRGAQT